MWIAIAFVVVTVAVSVLSIAIIRYYRRLSTFMPWFEGVQKRTVFFSRLVTQDRRLPRNTISLLAGVRTRHPNILTYKDMENILSPDHISLVLYHYFEAILTRN
jgi:hypothetical protein